MNLDDVGPARDAIDVAAAYPRAIHQAALAAQGVPLGPWQLSFGCKYGTSDRNSFSIRTVVDVTTIRTSLQATLADAEAQAATFLDTFSVVPTWMRTSLPKTADALAAATSSVEATITAARDGTLTPPLVDAAVADLRTVADTLDAGSAELTTGMQALAAFSVDQQVHTDRIAQVTSDLDAEVRRSFAGIQQQVDFAPCGRGDGQRQLAAMRARFEAASTSFGSIFTNLATQTVAAEQSVSLLIGTVLGLVNQYRPVIAKVQQADAATTASVLQGLQLKLACAHWQQLADHADRQLQQQRTALAAELTAAATAAARVLHNARDVRAEDAGSDADADADNVPTLVGAAEAAESPLVEPVAAVSQALLTAYGAP